MYEACRLSTFSVTIMKCFGLISARKRSCGKVMFLQLSVILFTAGGVPAPPWAGTPLLAGTPPGQVHPLGRYTSPGQVRPPSRYTPLAMHTGIRSTSGRYASYWNAFLLGVGKLAWKISTSAATAKTSIYYLRQDKIAFVNLVVIFVFNLNPTNSHYATTANNSNTNGKKCTKSHTNTKINLHQY